ncbi:MAG: hypothetical protein HON76_14075 [Candidatus Scalindua sp.]|jgi:hypothetical protein|nr:hypothetical protein [Candidatus Scalindua sp.]MBT5306158.1 hypothetical protein [Candidatus Scalindua sp.]MBT6230369.1 hypothetical protein [Candidatus Scalindua sp.]MBT6563646.1 hypothetical protein [Candidatus Scalindua sp.]MBT7210072.1 hypothetical protein [Candidatus Scalindua sp.]
MEQLLSSHHSLVTISEDESLWCRAIEPFSNNDNRINLEKLDKGEVETHRNQYWEVVRRLLPDLKENENLVDKLL